MHDFPSTDIGRRMGRPPLSRDSETKTTAVRLPVAVFERIVAAAGPNRMAAFIREAVEEKLDREAKRKRE